MKCVMCGKEFIPSYVRQNTCCEKCRNERHLENMRNAHSRKPKKTVSLVYQGQQCKHKDCRFRESSKKKGDKTCDYMLITGQPRGCEACNCNKYEPIVKLRRRNQICLGV
jgi:hypothetical protein